MKLKLHLFFCFRLGLFLLIASCTFIQYLCVNILSVGSITSFSNIPPNFLIDLEDAILSLLHVISTFLILNLLHNFNA